VNCPLFGLAKLQRLRHRRIHGGLLEDWLVRAGSHGQPRG